MANWWDPVCDHDHAGFNIIQSLWCHNHPQALRTFTAPRSAPSWGFGRAQPGLNLKKWMGEAEDQSSSNLTL